MGNRYCFRTGGRSRWGGVADSHDCCPPSLITELFRLLSDGQQQQLEYAFVVLELQEDEANVEVISDVVAGNISLTNYVCVVRSSKEPHKYFCSRIQKRSERG